MKIAILGGTGRMGKGLAKSYVQMGHELILGSRTIRSAEAAALSIKNEFSDAKIRGADSSTGNISGFEVDPGLGIRIVPISIARA